MIKRIFDVLRVAHFGIYLLIKSRGVLGESSVQVHYITENCCDGSIWETTLYRRDL